MEIFFTKKNSIKITIIISSIIAIISFIIAILCSSFTKKSNFKNLEPLDYTIQKPLRIMEESIMHSNCLSSELIGFSTGGAKDTNNFRENIKNGYFPISTDITYNGLFYDYYFDTGKKTESEHLFSPSYSCAIS